MRFVVMGAGAVGCHYGGLLAQKGHPVTLVGRPRHVNAIRARGLCYESGDQCVQVTTLAVSEVPEAVREADCVLVCVKSADSEAVASQIAPLLRPDCAVVSFQNGVDNAQRLSARLPAPAIPAAVYMSAEMVADGHVRHRGGDRLVLGEDARTPALAEVFRAAGVGVSASAEVSSLLWSKLIMNCAFNALAALTQEPCGPLVLQSGMWQVLRDIVDECAAVARLDGVSLPADLWDTIAAVPSRLPEQRPSTAQDLARGRRTEIDHLNGYIVRRAEALGMRVPVNRVLYLLVKQREAQFARAAG